MKIERKKVEELLEELEEVYSELYSELSNERECKHGYIHIDLMDLDIDLVKKKSDRLALNLKHIKQLKAFNPKKVD